MLRPIAGGIVGWLAMAVFTFITFTIVYLVIGVDGAYKPGVYDVSMLWIGLSTALSIIAALVGGVVYALVGRPESRGRVVFALVILGLGVGSAFAGMASAADKPDTRPDDVPVFEAVQNSKQPTWVAFLTAAIGGAGVYVGSGLVGGRKPEA